MAPSAFTNEDAASVPPDRTASTMKEPVGHKGTKDLSKRPGSSGCPQEVVISGSQQDAQLGRRPSQKVGSRSRQNSLRHAKNSTDILRQRSTQGAPKDSVTDGNSYGREGRQFTVGNVGNNGRIYLRPVVRLPQQRPHGPPVAFPSSGTLGRATFESKTQQALKRQTLDSTWSDTQTSRTPSISQPTNLSRRGTQHYSPNTKQGANRVRSFSVSTVDGHSIKQDPETGSFKIVIDRTDTLPGTVQRQLSYQPVLEVPIPHYRLGTPRFSARGTAFLQSSIYTRTSTNDDLRSSLFTGTEYDKLFPIPPGMDQPSTLSRRHSHSSPQPYSVNHTQLNDGGGSSAPMSIPVDNQYSKATITPSIYDELAANPNDPAVVRYSPHTGEITAASPARLIAQVTSENFLDYELLSDFFLTVRSYLSTHDLLRYLLARFEWAIHRFDENGRVIRVRAFAALRHWILNYFPYDFVVDRNLRVEFCDRLNDLAREVRKRSNEGASDLKLISDLKKCWNGRCILYWDNSIAVSDGQNDLDILPGGISGSRNSEISHPGQLHPEGVESAGPQMGHGPGQGTSAAALRDWFDGVLEAGGTSIQPQEQRFSVSTSRSFPISPMSEQSIPAMSCSIPARSFKKMVAQSSQAFSAHPVPARVGSAEPSALSNDQARPQTGHKRSGSLSDARRDDHGALSSGKEGGSEEQVVIAYPYSGSLIRGNLFPPTTPEIEIFAPSTPPMELSNLSFTSQDDESTPSSSTKPASPLSPGVKTLLVNIRRALSSKHSGISHHSSNYGDSGPSAPSLPMGKSATLPPNVVYQIGHHSQQSQPLGSKSTLRVDLLAAEIEEAFRRAIAGEAHERSHNNSSVQIVSDNGRDQPSPQNVTPTETHRPHDPRRNVSDFTNGSQSILIVDDTGLDIPDLPIVSGIFTDRRSRDSRAASFTMTRSVTPPLSIGPSSLNPTESRNPLDASSEEQRNSGMNEKAEPRLSTDTARPTRSQSQSCRHRTGSKLSSPRRSRSLSLRRQASSQGGAGNLPAKAYQASNATDSIDPCNQAPRLLRRRPGGDLRAHQNVHDLKQMPRPKSVGSATAHTDSGSGSGLQMANNGIRRAASAYRSPKAPQKDHTTSDAKKAPSLVRTHSSQPALRPSFEAVVAEFAQIPDDDEGGVEATLLKLEGRYQKSPSGSRSPRMQSPVSYDRAGSESADQAPQNAERQKGQIMQSPGNNTTTDAAPEANATPENETSSTDGHNLDPDNNAREGRGMVLSIYAESEESYDSTPLLERGLSVRSTKKSKSSGETSKVSMPQPLFSGNQLSVNKERVPQMSFEHATETESTKRHTALSAAPTTTTDSFLLDEDEYLSDLSSEMSVEDYTRDHSASQIPALSMQGPQETTTITRSFHPPTPPMTVENALLLTSQANQVQEQRKPPTPDPSPVSQHAEPAIGRAFGVGHRNDLLAKWPTTGLPTSLHMPYILAYDSELLAQQLTLIEKDALNEIDWRDLVEMRWNNSTVAVTNWVDYLRGQEQKGIDIVTARFNIMVKWALSEIVLTRDIEERTRTIVKYIHVAQQARRMHNYATAFQLTAALGSHDCSRLKKSWDKVPQPEKKILQELETLITPQRNFSNLRQAMEMTSGDEGCIPVVALYVHDLTTNAQKPAQIAGPRHSEPLVNFERYRTTAVIVKSLLRLIDSSSRYAFKPVEGLIERCLWMSSLTDDMIRSKSEELE